MAAGLAEGARETFETAVSFTESMAGDQRWRVSREKSLLTYISGQEYPMKKLTFLALLLVSTIALSVLCAACPPAEGEGEGEGE